MDINHYPQGKLKFNTFFIVGMDCGGRTEENNTYFEKPKWEASYMKGTCSVKVCKLNERICQLRLDFSHFVIIGLSLLFIHNYKLPALQAFPVY